MEIDQGREAGAAPEPEPGEAAPPGEISDLGAIRAQLLAAQRELDSAQQANRRAAEREALLRGELLHRVRNILAVIRSIFSRTIDAGGSLEDMSDHFRGRLDAIARNQAVRGIDPARETDLEAVLREELYSFQFGEDERIRIQGPEIGIGHDVAQLLGLAFHELVTNSIKFGVLSGADARARLRIGWSVAGGQLSLEWEERGVAIVVGAPLHEGFGREYIEQALPYQIGATTLFELRPGGLFCRLQVPLAARLVPGMMLAG
jgi:two-component sensor histidine kinase